MAVTEELKERPLPKRGETYNNLQVETIKKVKRPPGRPSKGLTQLNVKVPAAVEDLFRQLHEAAAQSKPNLTRGDYMAAILQAQAEGRKIETVEANKPPTSDARHGRTTRRDLWLTKDFEVAIAKAAKAKGLTLSEIVQTALTRAHQVEELQAEVARLKAEFERR